MRVPTQKDISAALLHSRWLLSLREPLGADNRMLADLGFAYDGLMQENESANLRSDHAKPSATFQTTTMSKPTQMQMDAVALYMRTPIDAEGWAKVSVAVWPLLKYLPPELFEIEGNVNQGGRIRLTEKGEIVVPYLI